MKKLLLIPLTVLLAGVGIMALSAGYEPYPYYHGYTPYFMMRGDLEKSVSYQNSKHDMLDPGKIYVRGTNIFINEKYKGVHIIDNSDPYKPKRVGFIFAPGCIDMAVKGNIIYMDNAVDLVAFDLDTHEVTKRIENFFPEHHSPEGDYYHGVREKDMILVGWKKNK